MDDVIRTVGLEKLYGGAVPFQALRGINLAIKRGEMVAIMGVSGSGKSTLMNILGCLDRPTAGEYWLDGKPLASYDDDQLAGDLEFGTGDRLGCTAAARVRGTELVADELHAAHVTALVGEHLDGACEVHELHPLALGLVELLFIDDHLVAAAAIDDGDLVGAETP